jgi:hypothetical protein
MDLAPVLSAGIFFEHFDSQKHWHFIEHFDSFGRTKGAF